MSASFGLRSSSLTSLPRVLPVAAKGDLLSGVGIGRGKERFAQVQPDVPQSPAKKTGGYPERPALGGSGRPGTPVVGQRRRVQIAERRPSVRPVTPYGDKYGLHPDHFDFDRYGVMQLTEEGLEDLEARPRAWWPRVSPMVVYKRRAADNL